MVFTPRPATELTVAQTFNALTDQLLLVRSGQVFKLAQLPVGPQGDAGADGADGSPGPSVELRTSGGFLQYQVAGSDNWINLVALSDISGSSISAAPGVPDDQEGREGDLYIDTNDGELYFRGPTNWFTIGNITGPQGEQGIQGPQGNPGSSGGGGGITDVQPDFSAGNVTGSFASLSTVELFFNNSIAIQAVEGENSSLTFAPGDGGSYEVYVGSNTYFIDGTIPESLVIDCPLNSGLLVTAFKIENSNGVSVNIVGIPASIDVVS